MPTIRRTETFSTWIDGLRDRRAATRVLARVTRLGLGNPGDVKPVGEGVSELRIDYGPGYRVYYKAFGQVVVVLLCGGDKSTQSEDIKEAKRLAEAIK